MKAILAPPLMLWMAYGGKIVSPASGSPSLYVTFAARNVNSAPL